MVQKELELKYLTKYKVHLTYTCKRENLLELYNLVASICTYDFTTYKKAYNTFFANITDPINAEIML